MIKNYFILAFRKLKHQKIFSFINIIGLTVGTTCCLMIFLFIAHELSYDNFHKNKENIYRVMRVGGHLNGGGSEEIAYLSPAYSTALLNDYPDAIQQAVRVMPDNDLITYKNVGFNEKKIYLVDDNFFEFFSFPLVKGNPATVLKDPLSIVLTESTAKKYFGNEDPIGKVVDWNKKLKLKVTGIAKDVPSNSHLYFDMVAPLSYYKNEPWYSQFPNNMLFTYVQLNPHTDPKKLISRFPQFMDKYLGKYYRENGFSMGLTIDPLKDIYFQNLVFDNVKHGSKSVVFTFTSIAVLILIIACINFMNLATARATDRSKEVGLRKVLGALRKQLIIQFIGEAFLFAMVSSILALGLLQLLMPAYNNLLGYNLSSYWTNPLVYIFLAGIVLIIGLLAGSYPALLLSSFSPIESLKGKLKVGKNGSLFRKTLVVFQFSISVLLIISITIIVKQMNYVQGADLGFNKEHALVVKLDNNTIGEKKLLFKTQLQNDPDVQNVSLMSGEPGGFHDVHSFETEAMPNEKIMLSTEFTDFEFAKTLGLKIIAGRDLSSQYSTDTLHGVLINRTTAAKLGYTPQQAVGKWIKNTMRDSLRRNIVGVVEDFHFSSLKDPIQPFVIAPNDDRRVALIRIKPGNLQSTINRIKNIYTSLAPAYPFEYDFLDEQFNQQYKSEVRQQTVLSIFSAIAIFIASLGLFGLSSYTAIKRTKEVGVRKVLGSSVENIVLLLSKDLLKPVLLGALIAMPVGYYFMNKWLQGFAYRIVFHWWMFAMAIAIAVIIALLTVGVQAVKAAMANPVKSLRTE
ncbi:MAG: ABC transporter permease [Bacteroidetes bacterium]|nr:ABC transporter permease [Bacteroidota bacterium]